MNFIRHTDSQLLAAYIIYKDRQTSKEKRQESMIIGPVYVDGFRHRNAKCLDQSWRFNLPHSFIFCHNKRAAMNKAVFLDRDGTLIEERDYLHRPEDVAILPGTGKALARLQKAGFDLFIVSNQSGVGRGYFSMSDVERVNEHLLRQLDRDGVRFKKIYIAPEAPGTPSRGRKPSPQFLFDARDEFGLDLSQSFIIGDKLIDLECGWNAGVNKSILVRTGYGAETERNSFAKLGPALVLDDLPGAAAFILKNSQTSKS